jgi:hypothetical protein
MIPPLKLFFLSYKKQVMGEGGWLTRRLVSMKPPAIPLPFLNSLPNFIVMIYLNALIFSQFKPQ